MEIFAGCMAFSAAVSAAGLATAVPVEYLNGDHFDVCRAKVQRVILDWILSGRLWAVALGTPCTRWSTARHSARNSSTDKKGLACAHFMLKVLRACRAAGAYVIIENPWSSGLWAWKPLKLELKKSKIFLGRVDQCVFGAAWRKPTGLAANLPGWPVCLTCPGHTDHVQLQGTVNHPVHGNKWRTSYASAYPPGLCAWLARCLGNAAPRHAWRQRLDLELSTTWERELAKSCGVSVGRYVVLPPVEQHAKLGWEGATGQWSGRSLADELRILRAHRPRGPPPPTPWATSAVSWQ